MAEAEPGAAAPRMPDAVLGAAPYASPLGWALRHPLLTGILALIHAARFTLGPLAILILYFVWHHLDGIVVLLFWLLTLVSLELLYRRHTDRERGDPSLFAVFWVAVFSFYSIQVQLYGSNGDRLIAALMLKSMKHPSFVAAFWLALSSDLIVRMSALGAKALCTVVVMAWQLITQRRAALSSSRPFDPLLPVSTSAPAPGSQSPLMTEQAQAAPSPHSPHPSADSDDVGSAAHTAGDPDSSAEAGERAGSNRWRLSAIHSSALHKRLDAVTALHSCVSTLWRQLCATIVWLAFYSDGLVDFGFLPAAYVSLKIVTILVSLTTIGRIVKAAAKILWRPLVQVGQAATAEQIQRCGSDDCSICQDGFRNPRHLTCGHVFCADCLTEWLSRSQTCPLCRTSIEADAGESERMLRRADRFFAITFL